MSGPVKQIGIYDVGVLAVVTLVELVVDATILGDAQPILLGLTLLARLNPNAGAGTGPERTLARVGVSGVALLLSGAVGALLA